MTKPSNNPNLTIRKATVDDTDQIFIIRTAVIGNHMSMEELAEIDVTPDTFKQAITDGSLETWVADVDQKTVGFCTADKEGAEIFALFLLPDFEKKGIGKQLLNTACQWLKQQGLTKIWLETGAGTRAQAFYLAQGWVVTDLPADCGGDDERYYKDLV